MKMPFLVYIFKTFICLHMLSVKLNTSNITKLQWSTLFALRVQSKELITTGSNHSRNHDIPGTWMIPLRSGYKACFLHCQLAWQERQLRTWCCLTEEPAETQQLNNWIIHKKNCDVQKWNLYFTFPKRPAPLCRVNIYIENTQHHSLAKRRQPIYMENTNHNHTSTVSSRKPPRDAQLYKKKVRHISLHYLLCIMFPHKYRRWWQIYFSKSILIRVSSFISQSDFRTINFYGEEWKSIISDINKFRKLHYTVCDLKRKPIPKYKTSDTL